MASRIEDLNFATRRQNHTLYSVQALQACSREINSIITRISESYQSILDHEESFAVYKNNTSHASRIEEDFRTRLFDGRKPSVTVTNNRTVDSRTTADVTWLDLIWGVPPEQFVRQDDGAFCCRFRGQTVTILECDLARLQFSPRHPLGGPTKVVKEDAMAEHETLLEMRAAMKQIDECYQNLKCSEAGMDARFKMFAEYLGLPIETPRTSNAQLSDASRDASPANSISVDPEGDIPYMATHQLNLRVRQAPRRDETPNTTAEGSQGPDTSHAQRSLDAMPRDADIEMTNTDSLWTSSLPNNRPLAPTEYSATDFSASSVFDGSYIVPKLEYPEENMDIQSSFLGLPSDSNNIQPQSEDIAGHAGHIIVSKKGMSVNHTPQEFAEASYFIKALKLKGMSWSQISEEYAKYFGVRRSPAALANPQIHWRNLQRDQLLVLKIRARAASRDPINRYSLGFASPV
ncbi:hypothetical protein N7510_005746 [Penicillium lagena]|uniref:uncharacterized protein n=1 Tax=Penicillium lagena TaxID=94218 RepID=UPI00254169B4|nr:uncharacterized protein N7510_005746 [Penicillium lagena]KAJ5612552.1 hypothetical protein N7510_005746 [Penicillium lagena]